MVAIPRSSLVGVFSDALIAFPASRGVNNPAFWFTAEAGVVLRTQWRLIIYACIVSDFLCVAVV